MNKYMSKGKMQKSLLSRIFAVFNPYEAIALYHYADKKKPV